MIIDQPEKIHVCFVAAYLSRPVLHRIAYMYQSTIRTCTEVDFLLWCLGSHWDWSVPSTQWKLPSTSRGNIETEINENI
jgi:hypothetical protein